MLNRGCEPGELGAHRSAPVHEGRCAGGAGPSALVHMTPVVVMMVVAPAGAAAAAAVMVTLADTAGPAAAMVMSYVGGQSVGRTRRRGRRRESGGGHYDGSWARAWHRAFRPSRRTLPGTLDACLMGPRTSGQRRHQTVQLPHRGAATIAPCDRRGYLRARRRGVNSPRTPTLRRLLRRGGRG